MSLIVFSCSVKSVPETYGEFTVRQPDDDGRPADHRVAAETTSSSVPTRIAPRRRPAR